MARPVSTSWTFVFAVLACVALAPSHAAEVSAAKKASEEQTAQALGLPAEVATKHVITLAGEKLAFTARAGAVRLSDAQSGAPRADVAFVSYERADGDPLTRPVAFVFNGGPGAGSAWLGLGALSPWRIRLDGDSFSPSTPPLVVDNAESWLGFVDLVFVDPPGTGFSKFLNENEETKKHFFSVQGDVDALAVVVRKWLTAHRRLVRRNIWLARAMAAFASSSSPARCGNAITSASTGWFSSRPCSISPGWRAVEIS